jgi:hypothetical protein
MAAGRQLQFGENKYRVRDDSYGHRDIGSRGTTSILRCSR